ncbi:MAG: M23 family metallopeptidase [Bacteroidales bacterium]|nr:M23 family metallopeptidase [Bacteroidales bacterium]
MKKPYICDMAKSRRYIFNPQTLEYESAKGTKKTRIVSRLWRIGVCLGISTIFWVFYTLVLGLELPKTAWLRQANDGWSAKVDIIDRNIDNYDGTLAILRLRDDNVYRSLFGMNPISSEVREAGFGGVDRYSYLDGQEYGIQMKNTLTRLDVLKKKASVQSKSYDEVYVNAERAGEMASCVPTISPIVPDRKIYHISSGFGQRTDPIIGQTRYHSGVDFALPSGSPVYATGAGRVFSVSHSRSGYGNEVVIDHGYGYKTRYSHLSSIIVSEGQTVERGDFIAKSGNSGRSTGPHLHYEVIYMGRTVNPMNHLDMNIPVGEYNSMVKGIDGKFLSSSNAAR